MGSKDGDIKRKIAEFEKRIADEKRKAEGMPKPTRKPTAKKKIAGTGKDVGKTAIPPSIPAPPALTTGNPTTGAKQSHTLQDLTLSLTPSPLPPAKRVGPAGPTITPTLGRGSEPHVMTFSQGARAQTSLTPTPNPTAEMEQDEVKPEELEKMRGDLENGRTLRLAKLIFKTANASLKPSIRGTLNAAIDALEMRGNTVVKPIWYSKTNIEKVTINLEGRKPSLIAHGYDGKGVDPIAMMVAIAKAMVLQKLELQNGLKLGEDLPEQELIQLRGEEKNRSAFTFPITKCAHINDIVKILGEMERGEPKLFAKLVDPALTMAKEAVKQRDLPEADLVVLEKQLKSQNIEKKSEKPKNETPENEAEKTPTLKPKN
jgi:hypothetical protein